MATLLAAVDGNVITEMKIMKTFQPIHKIETMHVNGEFKKPQPTMLTNGIKKSGKYWDDSDDDDDDGDVDDEFGKDSSVSLTQSEADALSAELSKLNVTEDHVKNEDDMQDALTRGPDKTAKVKSTYSPYPHPTGHFNIRTDGSISFEQPASNTFNVNNQISVAEQNSYANCSTNIFQQQETEYLNTAGNANLQCGNAVGASSSNSVTTDFNYADRLCGSVNDLSAVFTAKQSSSATVIDDDFVTSMGTNSMPDSLKDIMISWNEIDSNLVAQMMESINSDMSLGVPPTSNYQQTLLQNDGKVEDVVTALQLQEPQQNDLNYPTWDDEIIARGQYFDENARHSSEFVQDIINGVESKSGQVTSSDVQAKHFTNRESFQPLNEIKSSKVSCTNINDLNMQAVVSPVFAVSSVSRPNFFPTSRVDSRSKTYVQSHNNPPLQNNSAGMNISSASYVENILNENNARGLSCPDSANLIIEEGFVEDYIANNMQPSPANNIHFDSYIPSPTCSNKSISEVPMRQQSEFGGTALYRNENSQSSNHSVAPSKLLNGGVTISNNGNLFSPNPVSLATSTRNSVCSSVSSELYSPVFPFLNKSCGGISNGTVDAYSDYESNTSRSPMSVMNIFNFSPPSASSYTNNSISSGLNSESSPCASIPDELLDSNLLKSDESSNSFVSPNAVNVSRCSTSLYPYVQNCLDNGSNNISLVCSPMSEFSGHATPNFTLSPGNFQHPKPVIPFNVSNDVTFSNVLSMSNDDRVGSQVKTGKPVTLSMSDGCYSPSLPQSNSSPQDARVSEIEREYSSIDSDKQNTNLTENGFLINATANASMANGNLAVTAQAPLLIVCQGTVQQNQLQARRYPPSTAVLPIQVNKPDNSTNYNGKATNTKPRDNRSSSAVERKTQEHYQKYRIIKQAVDNSSRIVPSSLGSVATRCPSSRDQLLNTIDADTKRQLKIIIWSSTESKLIEMDQDENTRLHVEIANGKRDSAFYIAEKLIEMKHSVDLPNRRGETPLIMSAMQLQDPLLIGYLLENNANPNQSDKMNGNTALHYLARFGNAFIKAVKVLLDCPRTDPFIKNFHGETALFVAVKNHGRVIKNNMKPEMVIDSVQLIKLLLSDKSRKSLVNEVNNDAVSPFCQALNLVNVGNELHAALVRVLSENGATITATLRARLNKCDPLIKNAAPKTKSRVKN